MAKIIKICFILIFINLKTAFCGLAVSDPNRLWPNGVIPFSIGDDVIAKKDILQAMSIWESKTSVKFIPRFDEENYLRIYTPADKSICGASMGFRANYGADMGIGSECSMGLILHELGHVLGLMHEHQRSDRDNYIQIKPKYRSSSSLMEIMKMGEFEIHGEYDFNSIMHYQAKYFTDLNGEDVQLHQYLDQEKKILAAVLSSGDVQTVNILYSRLDGN